MSTQKPQKRLVGWRQYVGTIGAIVFGRSFAFAFRWGGLVCFGFSVFTFMLSIGNSDINAKPITGNRLYPLMMGSLYLGLFLGAMGIANTLFKKVEAIEPVELLTKHNAKDLPEIETLVRGSANPPTNQTELLRPAGHGAETPPEQLLRAAQENRQDS